MTLTVLIVPLLSLVALTLVASPADGDAQKPAKLQLVLAAPKEIHEGQPFLVRLTAEQPFDKLLVYWLDKEVTPSVSVWNNRHVALVMLVFN